MELICIDITNACVHSCSNCTRLCGHHKAPFFMGFDTFKKAVDSLEDYGGIINVMGGEPTLHPEFERFVDYLREKRLKSRIFGLHGPVYDMQLHSIANFQMIKTNIALFSSVSSSYYKHFETINDTFAYQALNDHQNACMHQALLMPRKELGISDQEWMEKREACWIQNTWSATITPKGAFFCEIAGALDMLFDGPGGWLIEPNWYLREPKDFADQLQWCELCSACLDVPKRLSNEERDDVTPRMFEKLKSIGSPKALKGKCEIWNPAEYEQYRDPTYKTGTEYIEVAGFQRVNADNKSLYAKDVVFLPKEKEIIWDDIFGSRERPTDWIAIGPEKLHSYAVEFLQKYILNPGCYYYLVNSDIIFFNVNARSIRDMIKWPKIIKKEIVEYYPKDKVVFFLDRHPWSKIIGGVTISESRLPIIKHDTKLVIYGAGAVATLVINKLLYEGITDFFVAVTSKEHNGDNICGYPINEINDLMEYAKNSIVILAVTEQYKLDMKENASRLGFSQIYSVI